MRHAPEPLPVLPIRECETCGTIYRARDDSELCALCQRKEELRKQRNGARPSEAFFAARPLRR